MTSTMPRIPTQIETRVLRPSSRSTRSKNRTTFLDLPRELRQQILLATYESIIVYPLLFLSRDGVRLPCTPVHENIEGIRSWVKKLRAACHHDGHCQRDIGFCKERWLIRILELQNEGDKRKVAKVLGLNSP